MGQDQVGGWGREGGMGKAWSAGQKQPSLEATFASQGGQAPVPAGRPWEIRATLPTWVPLCGSRSPFACQDPSEDQEPLGWISTPPRTPPPSGSLPPPNHDNFCLPRIHRTHRLDHLSTAIGLDKQHRLCRLTGQTRFYIRKTQQRETLLSSQCKTQKVKLSE